MGAIRTEVAIERVFALIFTCFENLIHGAIMFGWPSFVFVFNQRGYFSDMCDNHSENTTSLIIHNISSGTSNPSAVAGNGPPCPEQANRLQLVFSVAAAFQTISMFPIGLLFDRFGTRISRLVMSFLMLIGYLMMGLSTPAHSFLLFPATVCFTIGGVILLLSSMQIGNLFGRNKSTVITIINATYSASIIMSVIAKRSHEAGFSINTFFFILTGSVLLLGINTFVFLPTKFIPWPLPRGYTLTPCRTPPTTNPNRGEGACYQNQGYAAEDSSSQQQKREDINQREVYLQKVRAIDGGSGEKVHGEDHWCQNGVNFIGREIAGEVGKPKDQVLSVGPTGNGHCRENSDTISRRTSKEVDLPLTESDRGIHKNGISDQSRLDFKKRDKTLYQEPSDRATANEHCSESHVDSISRRTSDEKNLSTTEADGGVHKNGLSEQSRVDLKNVEVGRNMDKVIGDGTSKRIASEIDEQKRKEYGSLGSCLLSMPFFLLLLWQAFLEIDMIFTVGTLNFFLTRMAYGDKDLVSWYIDAFSIIQFLVLIVGPLGGLLMDRNNIFTSCSRTNKPKVRNQYADMRDSCLPLALATIASIGYSICLLIPSLQLQYLTFILLLIVPSLLFGIGPAVVGIVFPTQYFASVYGAMRTISGFFSFLQYPIFLLVQKLLDNDPFYVTVGFIIADFLTLILPAALYVKSRQQVLRTPSN